MEQCQHCHALSCKKCARLWLPCGSTLGARDGRVEIKHALASRRLDVGDFDDADSCRLTRMVLDQGPGRPTVLWIPRALKGRVAELFMKALAQWLELAEGEDPSAPSARRDSAALHLRILPQLVLRCPDTKQAEAQEGNLTINAVIRHRVQRAEAGEWMDLLTELIDDDGGHARSSPCRSTTTGAGGERQKQLQRAVDKARTGALRAAAQIVTGAGKAEPSERVAGQVRALLAMTVDEEERLATAAQRQSALLHADEVPRITTKSVRRKLRVLKAGAEPGPSGWRNSHLQLMGATPGGAALLARWTQQWALGRITALEARLWGGALVAPIQKGEDKVRPIALTEAIVKLSEAVLVDLVAPSLRAAMEPRQLSVRTPGAVEALARSLRHWVTAKPHLTLVELDLSNAYGSVFRSSVLAAVRRKCPALAPLLAAQWREGSTHAWVHNGTAWRLIPVERGTWQGAPASNPGFCCAQLIAMEDAMRPTASAAPIAEPMTADTMVPAWTSYADDTFLFGDAAAIMKHWEPLRRHLAQAGLTLNATKSVAYTDRWDNPSRLRGRVADPSVASLYEIIPRAELPPRVVGAVLSGTARAGIKPRDDGRELDIPAFTEVAGSGVVATSAQQHQHPTTPPLCTQDLAREAAKRMDSSAFLCQAIREIAANCGDLRGGSLDVAWQLLTKCAAHALDFDERLCPLPEFQTVAGRQEQQLRAAAASLIGHRLPDIAWSQACLPGPLGGLGMHRPGHAADGAQWASWLTTRELCHSLAAEIGAPAYPVGPPQDIKDAQRRLSDRGVLVELDGKVGLTQHAAAELALVDWIATDRIAEHTWQRQRQPTHRLLGRIGSLCSQLDVVALWRASEQEDRDRIQAASGRQVGATWTAPMQGSTQIFPNGHWRMATQMRLGTLRLPPNIHCAMPKAGGKPCRAILDTRGLHTLLCKAGPSRLRPHRSVTSSLAQLCRRSGAHVDIERTVPELATWKDGGCVDAVMDAIAWWPGRLQRHLIDITIRCPHAARYTPGEDATQRAENEKHHRYGQDVWPLAYTSYGRLGQEGQQLLELLCAEARDASGIYDTQRSVVAAWRRDLERSLLFALADGALQALGAIGCRIWDHDAEERIGMAMSAGADLTAEATELSVQKRMAARRQGDACSKKCAADCYAMRSASACATSGAECLPQRLVDLGPG